MSATPNISRTSRLSGFAAASLWHRRMTKTGTHNTFNKVRPRLSAELILHPIPRDRGVASFNDTRRAANVFHAA